MNVVDSSGWLEYFADGPNADFFAPAMADPAQLLVPSISIFEVFKRVLLQRDQTAALHAIGLMQQGKVVDLDAALASTAAQLSADLRIPMADSIILATARRTMPCYGRKMPTLKACQACATSASPEATCDVATLNGLRNAGDQHSARGHWPNA